ncbi:MAG: helix-hairpin-helix domain-containing protein [Aestuariibacter sp.]|jgi:competence protein ComEA|nr:helix-hairpin-helix domain-containing protein [Aestuariibacter sp.]MCP4232309.1 helix-hairpin-helix domain-containing protein [Aestuariibacter sp.]MCP4524891.1 helix-hairpin-helix domain-containing protein [Aestuariibacter sp.]MCP4949262.1 helix-hairpin-helix domain-containing protein [Aestuariibacter sp.]MCP5010224.1 helix-hairpin-helix domain-containing protein [Aestuariibacter sp.]|tara:strand:+ start:297 stop:524 length:228 start_codon:yes stop_codon:yes gene_type:complete
MDSVEHVASKHTLVNLNAANVEQLMALPGIGKSKAQAIVAYREEQGPFSSVDDLVNVKGIGKKLLAKLAASVEVR